MDLLIFGGITNITHLAKTVSMQLSRPVQLLLVGFVCDRLQQMVEKLYFVALLRDPPFMTSQQLNAISCVTFHSGWSLWSILADDISKVDRHVPHGPISM